MRPAEKGKGAIARYFHEWGGKETASRKGGEGDADKEEILKRLKEFREKMASGEVVIPVEILEKEEEQGIGANV